jgi:hypothetical protein
VIWNQVQMLKLHYFQLRSINKKQFVYQLDRLYEEAK